MDAHQRIYAAMNDDFTAIKLAEKRAAQLRVATRISVALLGLLLVLLFTGAIHALTVSVG
jgi:hypothetical protein